MRKRWWAVVRVVISLGVLAFVLLTIGLERIAHSLAGARPGPLLLAFGLYVTGICVRAVRWRVLLTALGLRIPLARVVYLYFVGNFFNTFLPTGFGGDAVRVLELAQEAQGTSILGTVVVDRLTGLLVLFVMALVALPFTLDLLPFNVWLSIGAVALAGLLAGALVLQGGLLRRLGSWLPGPLSLTGQRAVARAYSAVTACGWRAVGKALFVSLIFNSLLVLQDYSAAQAVGIDVGLVFYFVFVPVYSLALMAPITVGGLGVREGLAVLLFAQIGVDEALAVAFSLVVYAVGRVTGLIGGLLYLLHSLARLRQSGQDTEAALHRNDARIGPHQR
jgi:glycosyltransferase 2 family protein